MPSSLRSDDPYDGTSTSYCREPAYCPGHRFATPPTVRQRCNRTGASPRRDQSLRGHTAIYMRQRASHGITRRIGVSSLDRDNRCGLRRYERVCTWDRSHAGQFLTRQGISLFLLLINQPRWDNRTGGLDVSANLPMSPWGSDHLIISSHSRRDGRRMVSEDSLDSRAFPADCPHLTHCHCDSLLAVTPTPNHE